MNYFLKKRENNGSNGLRMCQSCMGEIQMDRCYNSEGFGNASVVQLHMFSDASRVGYASVGYLRLVNAKGVIHATFVMGKARLAPLKERRSWRRQHCR